MSTRLSRRGSFVVGLSIVVMLLVSAPMLAFADSASNPTTPPGTSATPPGQSDATPPGQSSDAAPGNSENAPGQASNTTTTTTTPTPPPGNSGAAPGQTKPDTSTSTSPPGNSGSANAGGNSSSAGGTNSNAGGTNSNAGGTNSNAGGTNSNAGGNSGGGGTGTNNGVGGGKTSTGGGGGKTSTGGGSNNGDPAGQGDCDQNDAGTGGAYDANCDGTHQNPGPGKSDNSPGKPADGTVGKADNKNPKGQQPGGSDRNKGYECEPGSANKGVGKGNPAHSGCTSGDDGLVDVCRSVSGVWTKVYDTTPQAGDKAIDSAECETVTKVWICHVNSGVNNYVVINVNVNSKQEDNGTGHAGHAGDVTLAATTKAAADLEAATRCVTPQTVQVCSGSGTNWAAATIQKSTYDASPSSYRLWTGKASDCYTSVVLDCPANGTPCSITTLNPSPDLLVNPATPGTPVTPVNPPDEVLGIILCPDGSGMPPSGKCKPSLLPDFVLGIRVNQPVQAAVQPALVKNPAAVAASLLPFTGGNLLPFVLVSAGLIGAGLPALRRRNGRS